MLTLRSEEGRYHSLILFRLSTINESGSQEALELNEFQQTKDQTIARVTNADQRQIYVMESSCPHLGADMSHADIEECETGMVAVCPWHRFVFAGLLAECPNSGPFRYDFDLKTGKSETGLKACTYDVEVKVDPKDGLEKVFMQTPEGGNNWRLVELRPVSEGRFVHLRLIWQIGSLLDFLNRIRGSTTTTETCEIHRICDSCRRTYCSTGKSSKNPHSMGCPYFEYSQPYSQGSLINKR